MGNYTSPKNEQDSGTTRTANPREQLNEPLAHYLVYRKDWLLETTRFLYNCPLREECWVKEQTENLEKELKLIQGEIQHEVFVVQGLK
jgi:hypothetical protein